MSNIEEKKLVRSIQQGDQIALAQLLESYQQRLYNIILRMVSNKDDALELAQDTMVKIVEHISDFNGQSKISTWMIRIAMNLSISHLRKRKLRNAVSLDQPFSTQNDQATALKQQIEDKMEPQPIQSVQNNEMVNKLQNAINLLEQDFKAVIVLRDIDQMDYAEIATVLNVPVGTVKSRLFRARLALRQAMLKKQPTDNQESDQAFVYKNGVNHD